MVLQISITPWDRFGKRNHDPNEIIRFCYRLSTPKNARIYSKFQNFETSTKQNLLFRFKIKNFSSPSCHESYAFDCWLWSHGQFDDNSSHFSWWKPKKSDCQTCFNILNHLNRSVNNCDLVSQFYGAYSPFRLRYITQHLCYLFLLKVFSTLCPYETRKHEKNFVKKLIFYSTHQSTQPVQYRLDQLYISIFQ